MPKTAYINSRVEPELKAEAEAVFNALGLSTSDAIALFLKQVVHHRGFPFPLRVPNKETVNALQEEPTAMKAYATAQAAMDDMWEAE